MFKKITFALIPATVLFIGLEVTFLLLEIRYPACWSPLDWQRMNDPAYTQEDWFTERFIHELYVGGSKYYQSKKRTFLLLEDQHSKYFNVVRGLRVTTEPIWKIGDPRPIVVMLLGGSTTYCSEVPDQHTWASYLQGFFTSDGFVRNVRVVNLGVPGASSRQEVSRLKFEIQQGFIPDVCVFLDGVNDVAQGVYNKGPHTTIHEESKHYRKKWYRRVAGHSSFLRFAYANLLPLHQTRPRHIDDGNTIAQLAITTGDVYYDNVSEAKKICDTYGIAMFAFLQPNLYTLNRPLTEQEKRHHNMLKPGMDVCVAKTYPVLRDRLNRLSEEGVRAIDISNVFDDCPDPVYLDFCHVSGRGNNRIAKSIHKHIAMQVKTLCEARKRERAAKRFAERLD